MMLKRESIPLAPCQAAPGDSHLQVSRPSGVLGMTRKASHSPRIPNVWDAPFPPSPTPSCKSSNRSPASAAPCAGPTSAPSTTCSAPRAITWRRPPTPPTCCRSRSCCCRCWSRNTSWCSTCRSSWSACISCSGWRGPPRPKRRTKCHRPSPPGCERDPARFARPPGFSSGCATDLLPHAHPPRSAPPGDSRAQTQMVGGWVKPVVRGRWSVASSLSVSFRASPGEGRSEESLIDVRRHRTLGRNARRFPRLRDSHLHRTCGRRRPSRPAGPSARRCSAPRRRGSNDKM